MMSLILLLIVAVAAFNIVAMLVMTVTDKRNDIAILRTLGASPRTVMGVFITQGLGDRLGRGRGRGDVGRVADPQHEPHRALPRAQPRLSSV